MNAEQIREAVQTFRFDRFESGQEKWEYIQRFETGVGITQPSHTGIHVGIFIKGAMPTSEELEEAVSRG